MKDLKEKTIRGGFARFLAQIIYFVLRVGSLMILARLLVPNDFGLVGMVTAFTGVLNLFRDFGLSTATVQKANVTDEQVSTLFWINMVVGAILTLFSLISAPFVARFYHEPRLLSVTAALALGFLFNAAGVQHSAVLQREMRFTALAIINIVSQSVGIVLAIGMALAGFGYWSLVALTLSIPLATTIGLWLTAGWAPGVPRRHAGVRSMLRFGSTVTLNGLVVYVAYNLDKVLVGRYWGALALGIYGRAYQFINIPTDNLNTAIGEVAFSALSRVQHEPDRVRNYFLKGYALVVTLTIPITVVCALFAKDLVLVLLGPKWIEAIPLFRLLAPTIFFFGIVNPLGWLMYATGLVGRSLRIALVLAPLLIAGYIVGLPYGAKGVAAGFSAVLALWMIPHVAWCVHGTVVSLRDILKAVSHPVIAIVVASGVALSLENVYPADLSSFVRLVLDCTALLAVYFSILLYVMDQKAFYLNVLRGMKKSSPSANKVPVSA